MSWMIESVHEAAVEPDAVFALYADPATWSSWGHSATWARSVGPLAEGGIVDVRASYRTVYHCRVRRLEPGRALEPVVRPALMTIINVYEVEPAGSGARIRHALEVSGPIGSLTRLAGLDRMYQRQLDQEVADVARIASGRADLDPQPRVTPQVSAPERIWHRAGRVVRGRDEQRG